MEVGLQRAQKIRAEGKMEFIMKAPLKELCPHLKKNCYTAEPFVGDLCGKLDGPVKPFSGGGSGSDPWVDKVVSFIRPSGSSDQGLGADIALGPPTTAKFVAIDKPETIIFAFTDNVLIDGEGNDLKLHEYINGDSPVEVFVSADNRRYISLGKTAHSTEYDLANYNVSTVRYVKLVGLADGGAAKGYDLMAIEALNSNPNNTT